MLLVPPQCVIHQSFILILNLCQRIRHLQPPNDPAVHSGQLPPLVLALHNGFFNLLQLLGHDAVLMDLSCKQGIVEVTDHPVHLVFAFLSQLELLELFSPVHGLPIVMKDGRGIQRLGEQLAAVVVESDNNGVQVEYDLHILCLLSAAVQLRDGEGDEVIPQVQFEPRQNFIALGLVAPLVQGEASCRGHIGGFIQVVSIFEHVYERMLSWVKVLLAYVAGGVAPRAACCWCADQCTASQAAIRTLLFAMALANCSSLHVEQTFRSAVCDTLRFFKGDQQRDFAQMTVFRSPNVGIDVLYIGLVLRCH